MFFVDKFYANLNIPISHMGFNAGKFHKKTDTPWWITRKNIPLRSIKSSNNNLDWVQ